MNLHGIVSGAVGSVNPLESVVLESSTGSTINPDGSQSPSYSSTPIIAQFQPLEYNEIIQADSLQIQGTRCKVYANAALHGQDRASNKGGDLITRANSTTWLVVVITEAWPDWTAAILTLQNGS